MRIWNSFPMLRVIPPFLVGVVLTAFLVELISWNEIAFVTICTTVVVLVLIIVLSALFTNNKVGFGMITWLLMLVLGSGLTLSVSNEVYPDNLKSIASTSRSSYLIKVVDEPQIKERSVKVVAELADDSLKAYDKVLLYFKRDSLSESLRYGEWLVVRTKLDKVENLGNPNEFNYKRYLRFNGISYRGYVDANDAILLSHGKPSVWRWLYSVRSQLIQKLKESGIDGDELSVASALILGYRADLDKELMTAYAGAGATHVLAVSGLHVGIVYVILNTALRFMDRKRKTKLLKTIILIVSLFGYAGLTGLSASVFRAATMFSFVAVGKAINRDTNIFNTLAASAFVLIAFNPMIIMQVGFQLSYAAVIGIVLIQPRLFNLYAFQNSRFLDWTWSITCVSVAAQIATAPLGLLYFHQFPNLFLVSNLLVIPAAAAILYIGFSLFLLSFWKPTLLFFGFLLKTLISVLNKVVVWIEQVPYSVLSGIDISTIEAIMIYAMIAGFLIFIINKSKLALHVVLVLSIVFMIIQVQEVYYQGKQRFVTIYNIKNETALALINGTNVTFLARKAFYENNQAMLFHVRHHWWKKGIGSETLIELNENILNKRLKWGETEFSVLNASVKSDCDIKILMKDELDFVILDDISWKRIHQLNTLSTKKMVVSNNFGSKTVDKVKECCDSFYSLRDNGAVTIE